MGKGGGGRCACEWLVLSPCDRAAMSAHLVLRSACACVLVCARMCVCMYACVGARARVCVCVCVCLCVCSL